MNSVLIFAAAIFYSVSADKPDNLYRCGETAEFTVAVKSPTGARLTSGSVFARLDNFGEEIALVTNVDLSVANPFVVKGSLGRPGALRLCLRAEDGETTWGTESELNAYEWAVMYEPEKIVKGSSLPEDFDRFWSAAKAKLEREVPLDAQLVLDPKRSDANHRLYRVSFATFGRRVYGTLRVPADAGADKKYPVYVNVPGAGCGQWNQQGEGWDGAINLYMTVFDWEPQPDDFPSVDAKFKAMTSMLKERDGLSAEVYSCAGIKDGPESYWYYPVILGISRAIDFVAAQPYAGEVRYQGTSQGGMFGLILTGLNQRIRRAVVYVPAGCDTLGYLQHRRRSGWPRLVEHQAERNRAAVEKWAPYFDGANFATRIRCPIRFVVGYSDTVCPPAAVWAGFNACASVDKEIEAGIGMTHAVFGYFYDKYNRWLRQAGE